MSYLTTLKLDQEPFSTSPDPAFFYRTRSYSTILNRLEIAIRLKRGLSIVLGDVGLGKTTLSRTLTQCFNGEEDEYDIHIILDPLFRSEYEFLSYLTKTFGVDPVSEAIIDQKIAIERYLYHKSMQEGKTTVLIIDEGQKLSDNQLEILRTLLNYETNEYKLLQLVIFGQMELLDKIKKAKNFSDRISLKHVIQPCNRFETEGLISFRLKQAGYFNQAPLFSREAVDKIYEYTQGYPRQIGLICHNAIELIIMEGRQEVLPEIIDRVLEREKVWC